MPSESNITWATLGRILLTPEYPNAILYGDGTFNNGTISLNNSGDQNWRIYYEWLAYDSSLQDYTILLRYELPQDFSSWATSNALTLSYITSTAQNTDNKVDFNIYKSSSSTAVASAAGHASSSWTDIVVDDADLNTVTWAAGDVLIIEIKLYSKNGNFARVGDITLNYER
jgi:hypothetical protein